MNAQALIQALSHFPASLRSILSGVSQEEARQKPDGGGWSMLEVVRHMEEEERRDFRARVSRTLTDPTTPWDPIDPEGWVAEHEYNAGDLATALEEFERERKTSIAWLEGLESPDWTRKKEHPQIGALAAGDLFTAWAAHDLLHLQQLVRLRLTWVEQQAGEFDARYARP